MRLESDTIGYHELQTFIEELQEDNATLREELATEREKVASAEARTMQFVKALAEMRDKYDTERDKVKRMREGLQRYADDENWSSVGTYKGKPSDVLMWKGWIWGTDYADPIGFASALLKETEP